MLLACQWPACAQDSAERAVLCVGRGSPNSGAGGPMQAYAAAVNACFDTSLTQCIESSKEVVPVAFCLQGAVKRVLELRQASSWVTPTSGVLLVAGGTYALLSRLLPAV